MKGRISLPLAFCVLSISTSPGRAQQTPSAPAAVVAVDVPAALKKLQSDKRPDQLAGLALLRSAAVHEQLADHKQATIEQTMRLMHSEDRELGNAACDVLSWLDADALPPLVAALQSKDTFVQSNAARVIGSIVARTRPDTARSDIAIVPLAKLLRGDEKSARHNAFYAISELGPAAIPHMIDALDAEEYFQRVMMRGFVRLGEQSVGPLCKVLRTGDVTGRRNAGGMLLQIARQAPEVLPLLETQALTPLTEAIEDQDPSVRVLAISTMGGMGRRAEPSLDKIVAAMKQPDVSLGPIALAIGQIGPEMKHLDALFDGAERAFAAEGSTNNRMYAAEMFGRAISPLGDDGVNRVVRALGDSREGVRQTALWALYYLGPKAAPGVPELIKELDRGDSLVPAILGAIGEPAKDAVPHLIRQLEQQEWGHSRRAFSIDHYSPATQALSQIGRPALPALMAGLKHKDDMVRAGCLVALENMDTKVVVPLAELVPLCRDEHPLVRAHAMLALVHHGLAKDQLIPILNRLKGDSHPGVAAAAKHELARRGLPTD